MRRVLVYADSLSWGIVPGSRDRLPFAARWPGVLEAALVAAGQEVRVLEDCLNGRRTAWDDPFKPGRRALDSVAQVIEAQSPLELAIVMLGTNDFQVMHPHDAWTSAQGLAAVLRAIRTAPIEPGLPVPALLAVAPPALDRPRGPIGPKFAGGDAKCIGLAAAQQAVCAELDCAFFDAGSIVQASRVDGVHLDAPEHERLGQALMPVVARQLS